MLEAINDAFKEEAEKTEQVAEQVTEQVCRLVSVAEFEPVSGADLMKKLSLSHRPTFLYSYIKPALDAGLIEMTVPEKPNSSKQKYRLTKKGFALKERGKALRTQKNEKMTGLAR